MSCQNDNDILDIQLPNKPSKESFRYKYERTVWPTASMTTETIYRTEPVYVSANPFTVGLLNDVYDKDEKYWAPPLPLP